MNVVLDRRIEERGLLLHVPELMAQPVQVQGGYIDAVEQNDAKLRIVKPKEQRNNPSSD